MSGNSTCVALVVYTKTKKCHEVIMSLIRLSHTNEVECKSIARDRIRRTRAMKHQMHDINVVKF